MIKRYCLAFLVIALLVAVGVWVIIIAGRFPCQKIVFLPSISPTPSANIQVSSPKAGEEVSFPFTISGQARVFENMLSVRLLEQGTRKLLYQVPVYAKAPDMGQFGPFEQEIGYLVAQPADENVILEAFWNSPKDGSEIDAVSIPLKLKLGETSLAKVFFGKQVSSDDCTTMFPFARIIPKIEAPARRALELLLEGPSLADGQDVFTSINAGVKIQSLTIKDGIARVDFDEQLEFQVGGSCRVAAIRSQIAETLKQFPTVKNVIISINGRTEDILQP